jgi:anaerobic ribonucleoside-triphosphate reductase
MDNATLITAIMATVDAYIDSRIKKALEDHQTEIDLDRLRELVGPIVEARIEDAVEEAINEHLTNYDHDEFQTENDVESKMENWDLDDQVADAVRNLRFTVSVD